MRSVVVVLPASMCAMMPMLRVFSSEYCRCTVSPLFFPGYTCEEGGQPAAPLFSVLLLPAVMREGLVGLRHLVRVLSLLHGGAAVVGGVQQLTGQLLRHAPLRPPARGADHPAHGQGRPPLRPHLDRHLIRGAATRRDFTSTAGFTLSMAVLNILMPSCLARSSMAAMASYMMRSAVDF